MPRNNINLGIFGFGCVGQGLYNVLSRTQGIQAEIKKICIKHGDKQRPIASEYFTLDHNVILDDPDIDVVVELIDDADAAFQIVKRALSSGKAVVSANKKMIAEHLQELYELQRLHNVAFLYEGCCCASIPIIRNLEEYYDNDLLSSVEGIFNGTTNYILTKIFEDNLTFDQALSQAQTSGFAETDPTLDIEGYDSKFKLCIILLHTFGLLVKPENVFNYGIQNLNQFDIEFAKQRGYRIKLLAKCRKVGDEIHAFCMPQFVNGNSRLTHVDNEYNGVVVESVFSETQFFSGKGAGGNPTGSAVLSDISALTYDYRYEYKKYNQQPTHELTQDAPLELYVRYKNRDAMDIAAFNSVSVRYESKEDSYVIGKMNLERLQSLQAVQSEDMSLVLVNG